MFEEEDRPFKDSAEKAQNIQERAVTVMEKLLDGKESNAIGGFGLGLEMPKRRKATPEEIAQIISAQNREHVRFLSERLLVAGRTPDESIAVAKEFSEKIAKELPPIQAAMNPMEVDYGAIPLHRIY